MPLSIRELECPSCLCIHDRDVNAAKNIRIMGLADTLGLSDCVKGSSAVKLVSASAVAKAQMYYLRRSQEASTRMNPFI
jgi:transposase